MADRLKRIALVCAAIVAAAATFIGYGLCRKAESAPPAGGVAGTRASMPVPPLVVGMNLGGLKYWLREWPFNDLVANAGNLTVATSKGWEPPEGLVSLDATGHPVNVPAGTQLAITLQGGAGPMRGGAYQCRISPGWTLRAFGTGTQIGQVGSGGTRFTLMIPDVLQSLAAVVLKAGADKASLTDFSCTAGKAEAGLLNPVFLDDNRSFRVLRFMDWMATNNAPHRDWASRPTPRSFSQNGLQGVAVEYMVEVANTLHADPWFNMPMDADPDYYRQFAIYVRDHLARDRKIYVELSNEVWNTAFQQAKDATRLGQARYPGANAQQASDWYYGDRVRDLMAVWSDVFRGQEGRLVRVLASQAVNPRRAEQALSHGDTWKSVDALATAPYFGMQYKGPAAPGPARVDALFAEGPAAVDAAIGYALAAKAVAASHGLRYIAYESGPGFDAGGNRSLAEDILTMSRDQRIYPLYSRFLTRWRNEVGDLIVLFASVSSVNNAGYYGHKEYTGQPLAAAPKMRAAVDAARER